MPDSNVTLALGDTVDEAMKTIHLGGTDWDDAVKAYNTCRVKIKGEIVARVSKEKSNSLQAGVNPVSQLSPSAAMA